MSQTESETIAGERDKHSDARASSPARETRRRNAAVAVGGGATVVLLWLLWSGPAPQQKAEYARVQQTAVFEPAIEKPAPKELPRLAAMMDIKPAPVIEPPPPAPPPPSKWMRPSRSGCSRSS